MKDNTDKYLDKVLGNAIKKAPLESPSMDFSTNVISKIEALEKTERITYKPLISKKIWVIVGVICLGMCVYMATGVTWEERNWGGYLNFDLLPSIELPKFLSEIRFSKTLLYAVIVFAALLFVQVPLLKKELDKRLEY